MKKWMFVNLSSRLREKANKFIQERLNVYSASELAPCDGAILTALYHKSPVKLIDLARDVNRSKSTVSVLVDKLEKQGYLRKAPSTTDARVTEIDLTTKGREFENVFNQITKDLMLVMTAGIKVEELSTTERVIKQLLNNLPE